MDKMIKEMADTLEYLCFADTIYDEDDELIPNYKGIAKELINVKGYRKVDKNSVVISKENYDKLCHLAYFGYDDAYEKGSKETAEKIYKQLQEHGTTYVKKWIKEQFGVEVEKC